jgi:hypothetical protein
VIVDVVVGLLEALFRPVLEAIPTLTLGLPAAGAQVGDVLRKMDSLIPILGPLRLMVALLSLLGVWFVVRGLLLARHVLLP